MPITLRSLWPFSRKSFTIAREVGSASRNTLYLRTSESDLTNNSIVMAAVFWAMRNIRQAPSTVVDEKDGDMEIVADHPLTAILRSPQGQLPPEERGNLTGRRLRSALIYSLMLDGNAYVHKIRSAGGRVIGLDWIPHMAVEVVARKDQPQIVSHYMVAQAAGRAERVEPADIVHFRWGCDPSEPTVGLSPLKSVMRQVMTDNEIAIYCHSVIKNPYPGLVITPNKDARLTQEDADYLAKKVESKASGERAGGTIVTTIDMKMDPLRVTPDQMAIDKLNRLPEERITAVIGIPSVMLGLGTGMEASTYNNKEQASEDATEQFLLPHWEDMADTWTDSLLPEFEVRSTRRVWFDTSDVKALQEDQDATHERARQDFTANVISKAEARVAIGYEPMPGDENVYAWMLKPAPMAPPGLPTGPKKSLTVRHDAESR